MQLISSPLFVDFLSQLSSLPVHDGAWQEVDALIGEVQRLRTQNRAQALADARRQERRADLDRAAAALCSRRAAQLHLFHVADEPPWASNEGAADNLELVWGELAALEQALTAYSALEHFQRDTLRQRRTVRQAEEQFEREVEEILTRLRWWYTIPTWSEPEGADELRDLLPALFATETPDRAAPAAPAAPAEGSYAGLDAAPPAVNAAPPVTQPAAPLEHPADPDTQAETPAPAASTLEAAPWNEPPFAAAPFDMAQVWPVDVAAPAAPYDLPVDPDGGAEEPETGAQPDAAVYSEAVYESEQEQVAHYEDTVVEPEGVLAPDLDNELEDLPEAGELPARGIDEEESGLVDVPGAEPVTRWSPSPADQLTPQGWCAQFWSLVEGGDLAAAYWLSRSLAAQPEPIATPLSDWQVAALQASWWLPNGRGALAHDLTQIVYDNLVEDDPLAQISAVAAALTPTLTHPITGIPAWLKPLANMPEALNRIIAAVQDFVSYAQPLDEADVLAVRGADERAQELAQVVTQAQLWLQQGPHRVTFFQRASDVWRTWSNPNNGILYHLVELVAANREQDANLVSQLVAEWRDVAINDRIDDTDIANLGKVPDRKSRFIEGSPRTWLVTQSEDALSIAERWCALVLAREKEPGWYRERVDELFHAVNKDANKAHSLLLEIECAGNPETPPAIIRLLRWALGDLCRLLGIPLECPLPPRASGAYPQNVEPGLAPALRYRLLSAPELHLHDNQTADPEPLEQVAPVLRHVLVSGRTPQQALTLYLQQKDLRFAAIMLANLPAPSATTWARTVEQIKRVLQAEIEVKLKHTGDAVELAYVDGLLDDEERSDYAHAVEAVRREAGLNFADRLNRLAEVRKTLAQSRSRRLHHQQERWHAVHQRLEERSESAEPGVLEAITRFMNMLVERKDIVVIDERLARLEELVDKDSWPALDEFVLPRRRDYYREFARFVRELESREDAAEMRLGALRTKLARGELPAIYGLAGLSKARQTEVRNTIDHWHGLRQTKPEDDELGVRLHVAHILRFLGFTLENEDQEDQAVTLLRSGPDYAHLSANMTASNVSPIPQYGSLNPGVFDVVCLWERPEPEIIGLRLQNLKLRTDRILVFFLGRLTKKRRLGLLHYMRQNVLARLVLDEYLLLYLARETARLSAFFSCTLPLARVNPYAGTGPVAQELFKGRTTELVELQGEGGYAMIYGGRQLGKSALLQQVEREFHNPAAERYVIRTEIQHVGDPASQQADPELIWQRLKSGFEDKELIPRTTASKRGTIQDQVRDYMRANPQRRVLVLFDEADNFLAADRKRNFESVSMLRTLMDDTHRRFKVIFAGLHNVLRYESVPNQPFAHLPGLGLGPLEPRAARELIVQPLEALGFRFSEDDPSAVLGILAYTNSHPGLIQLFCQKLLNMLYDRRITTIGPWKITRQDVEAVYLQRDVQDEICRRFEWTLGLDERYKALAYIIVLEQLQERDGFSEAYTAMALQELGQIYWPQAFETIPLDEFRGYLNEMVGLGVLAHRRKDNTYRLRSPNLVRLMGSAADIEASLQELSRRSAPKDLVQESHHAPLDETAARYSPFTFVQLGYLNPKRYGVGLVFGSQALGIDLAAAAIQQQFLPPEASGSVQEVRIAGDTGDAFRHWLKRLVESTGDNVERLIVYRRMHPTRESMADQVEAALDFCTRRQLSRRQWMRVLFIFDAVATNEWLRLASDVRKDLERRADALVVLRTWDDLGISQRLRQHTKLESSEVLNRLLLDLGGWPWLLDRVADTWGGKEMDNPLPAIAALEQQLYQGDLGRQFLAACGLEVDDQARRILDTIIRDQEVPLDLLVPDYLGDSLSSEECVSCVEYLRRMELIEDRVQQDRHDVIANPLIAHLLSEHAG